MYESLIIAAETAGDHQRRPSPTPPPPPPPNRGEGLERNRPIRDPGV